MTNSPRPSSAPSPKRRHSMAALIVVTFAVAIAALWTPLATAGDPKPARYGHAAHEKRKVDHSDCKACHSLDDKFDVLPSTRGKSHQPCNASGCHREEFFSREPNICGVCHDATEPWANPPALVRRRKTSEFGGYLSHKSHLQSVRGAGGNNGACVTCHGDVYRGTQPGKSGHNTCSQCHGNTSEPSMGSCGGCHKLGSVSSGSTRASEWAVTARFKHDTHASDPRSRQTETACVACHADIGKATGVSGVVNPTMRSCMACHDGKYAFKATGFECRSCHGDNAAATSGSK